MKISFIVICGGNRPQSMERLLRSINLQNVDEFETVVVGNVKDVDDGRAVLIDRPDLAKTAAICEMRNIGVKTATGEIVVLLDDDIELAENWYDSIKDNVNGENWDIAGCKVTTPAGDRWYDWNWASRTDPETPPRMLDYGETSDNLYISGCMMIIKRRVFDKVMFDENLKNHQRDDVDFCHRAIDAGFSFAFLPTGSAIHHLDPAGRSDSDPAAGGDFYSAGINLYRLNRFAEALECFEKAESADRVRAVYHCGLCHDALGDREKARAAYESVIAAGSGARITCGAHYRLAVLLENEGDSTAALENYRAVLAGIPEHHKAARGVERLK